MSSGRSAAPHTRLWTASPTISRRHARIVISAGGATLEDLDSKNGTFLRGNKVTQPAPLSDGDLIRVGSVSLTFRVFSLPGSTETADDS